MRRWWRAPTWTPMCGSIIRSSSASATKPTAGPAWAGSRGRSKDWCRAACATTRPASRGLTTTSRARFSTSARSDSERAHTAGSSARRGSLL
ncbi:hypothetical protein DYB28_005765 [Aphanomyces astaci]|uniref:Uncharacterized protein n=1 Tax=Aphanomyces astaci TaxID=112090 RepID=A0A3L6VML7_APHAT|nr:hypothetical protein DYB35_011957 [Aphanomyces astaci]RLO09889.1 hypothetical protein DYB28_005765 [Aphanomyces astaci]